MLFIQGLFTLPESITVRRKLSVPGVPVVTVTVVEPAVLPPASVQDRV